MKLFRSTPIFIQGILIAGMLTACQNENDTIMAPEAPTSTANENARTAVAAGTLIKDGSTDLSYNDQNLLRKEFKANQYYEFTYTPQLISALKYQDGTPSPVYTYTLDASGRCVQTVTDKTYIYEYNDNGQLAHCYNKNQPNERREFTYMLDTDGWKKSLSKVKFYNASGVKTKELTFNYGAAAAYIPDKRPVTPDVVLPADISRYLPIFGSFNTNLVKILIEDKYQANGQIESSTKYLYSYTLDYTGRAKKHYRKEA